MGAMIAPTIRPMRSLAGAPHEATDAVASLRPFRVGEFGDHPAAPSPAHVQAANQLILQLRQRLVREAGDVNGEAERSRQAPTPHNLQLLLTRKQSALNRIKGIERIWDYYLELFGQRQSRFADALLGMDRMANDCYQAIYTGLGTGRSIPSPAPFTYMETGFTPATYRRGIRLSRLGRNANPFPIVKLPYHRLVNPWTLGAVHHEVSHNLQSDLGLWQEAPRRIVAQLTSSGIPPQVAQVWGRWHKETWADLCGILLGGPGIVASLLDVLARSTRSTQAFNPTGVHPTPYLRALIGTELLRRMGFEREAADFTRLWMHAYPKPAQDRIPRALSATFPDAHRQVVEIICYQPYRQLGDKSLAEVFSFDRSHERMTREAAQRMARGVDPGIIPSRFLVGAARHALDHRMAPPEQIARNFYQALRQR